MSKIDISVKKKIDANIYPRGPQGPQGIQGPRGETGNGIANIEKTGTVGLVDTYTITFTDGSTFDFTVTNANAGNTYTKSEIEQFLAQKVNITVVTDAYSSLQTYAVGDYCIYENTLYKCTTAITTAEAWNSAHWTATTIATELASRLEFQVVETW